MLHEQSDTEHRFIFPSGNREVSTRPCSKTWLLPPTATQQLSCYGSASLRELQPILHRLRIPLQAFQAGIPHPRLFYWPCLQAGGTEPRSRVQQQPQTRRVFTAVLTLEIAGKSQAGTVRY